MFTNKIIKSIVYALRKKPSPRTGRKGDKQILKKFYIEVTFKTQANNGVLTIECVYGLSYK